MQKIQREESQVSSMHILAINGSPRGEESSTRKLLLAACEGAGAEGADTTTFDISEMDIGFCTGCGSCYQTGHCFQNDDFEVVYHYLTTSEGVIFSSPVYINSVTAQLKTFFDRLADAIHTQRLAGTYGCSISTAGGANAEGVAEYQNSVIRVLGGTTTGSLGVNILGDPAAVERAIPDAKELGSDLVRAIREKRQYPEQDEEHRVMGERMIELVSFNKDVWISEYEYWRDQGAYPR